MMVSVLDLVWAFLVKGKFPQTLLSIWLGVGEALPFILGMEDPCSAALSGQSPRPVGARL
jgi:hypothetical protein